MYKIAEGGSQLLRLSRSELFAGLFILGCTNGLAERAIYMTYVYGWAQALFNTFDISIIVLAACFVGISFVLDDQSCEISSADIAVSAVLFCLIILPIGATSWLAVTALSLYILLFTAANESRRRGAIILLATTVPMLWNRLLLLLFGNFILDMDASLVGLMLGTHRLGNMVEFADHSGTLEILPPCSSLANMSLAMLFWVTISQVVRHGWCHQDISWCLLACASVVAVNVARLSLMGLSPSYYDTIHSAGGNTVTNVIVFSLTVLICLLGVRREAFSRA
jgi:exosortase/archaeosortase family protein